MRQAVAAIVNPVSGRRDLTPLVVRVGRFITEAGATFLLHRTQRAGEATTIASRLADEVEAVLVAGGDGTVCEVVNGLAGRRVPMLVLPAGTENLLARELGVPRSPREAARALLYGDVYHCDVGVMNERRFLVVAGVGFDAECVYRMARMRRGHITHWDYFWPIWRSFWAHKFPRLRVEAEDDCIFEGRGFVLIGVMPRYSVGMRILADAVPDDGLLDICVFPCVSRWRLIGHAFRVFTRRHIGRGGVVYRQARSARIESPDNAPIEVDGEVAGRTPAVISIERKAAGFLRCDLKSDGSSGTM